MITGTLNDWSLLSLTTVFHVAVGNMIQLNLHCSYLVESLIFEHPRKMKIGFKNHVVQEIRGEPTALTEGREQMFWIKLIQSSLRVTKSRFYCVPSQLTNSNSEYFVLMTFGIFHWFTFVPVFLGRPNEENQSPPLLQMAWNVTIKIYWNHKNLHWKVIPATNTEEAYRKNNNYNNMSKI